MPTPSESRRFLNKRNCSILKTPCSANRDEADPFMDYIIVCGLFNRCIHMCFSSLSNKRTVRICQCIVWVKLKETWVNGPRKLANTSLSAILIESSKAACPLNISLVENSISRRFPEFLDEVLRPRRSSPSGLTIWCCIDVGKGWNLGEWSPEISNIIIYHFALLLR